MRIEPHISRYIDVAIERQRKIFDKNVNHYMSVNRELIQDDLRKVLEIVNDKPGREEVRKIIQEEIRPLRTDMQIFKEELIDHRTRIERLEKAHV